MGNLDTIGMSEGDHSPGGGDSISHATARGTDPHSEGGGTNRQVTSPEHLAAAKPMPKEAASTMTVAEFMIILNGASRVIEDAPENVLRLALEYGGWPFASPTYFCWERTEQVYGYRLAPKELEHWGNLIFEWAWDVNNRRASRPNSDPEVA